MNRMRPCWVLLGSALCATIAGCGLFRPQRFGPTADARAPVGTGHAAVVYSLAGGKDLSGQVRVWSREIRDGRLAGVETEQVSTTTVRMEPEWRPGYVHIGFLIRNDGIEPVRLDLRKTRLDLQLLSGGEYPIPSPGRTADDLSIPPGERKIDLFFFLPRDFDIRSITSYDVSWTLQNGAPYAKTTRFDRRTGSGEAGFAPFDPYHVFPTETVEPTWPYPDPYGLRFHVPAP